MIDRVLLKFFGFMDDIADCLDAIFFPRKKCKCKNKEKCQCK